MEKEFSQYTESLELKELGFDEPCLGYYAGDILCTGQPQEIHLDKDGNYKKTKTDSYPIIAAPTYSQAFRWFREKYNLLGSIDYSNRLKWYYVIREFITSDILPNLNTSSKGEFESYEEAELECLKKLIQIIKQK